MAAVVLLTDFYSHAREGRDQGITLAGVFFDDFYSHAREGRDSRLHGL